MEKKNRVQIIQITAPVSGKVVALEDVPDPVFSGKMMGDGCAIIPSDGKIYSPVDGTVASVAPTKHAIGFTDTNGVDILVHFGLETVGLNGEPFNVLVKQGDKVKKGQLVAEANLDLLKEKNINPITPVIVCGGAQDAIISANLKDVEGGKEQVLSIEMPGETVVAEVPAETTAQQKAEAKAEKKEEKEAKKKAKKSWINFDALQKFGKALMVVIAVMPAAGL